MEQEQEQVQEQEQEQEQVQEQVQVPSLMARRSTMRMPRWCYSDLNAKQV